MEQFYSKHAKEKIVKQSFLLYVTSMEKNSAGSVVSQLNVLRTLYLGKVPATNSTLERSFSALRRIKSHLKSTMSQSRLNSHATSLPSKFD